MTLRAKAVASLSLVDGFGITVTQDEHGVWRFISLHRRIDPIRVEISKGDRQRGFESAEAVVSYFRRQYGHRLSHG